MSRDLRIRMLGVALTAAYAVCAGPASGLEVRGHRLIDAHGHAVVLHGVNVSGTEDSCIAPEDYATGSYGAGVYAAAPDDQAFVRHMRSWRINAVRVPLNESCWLGIAVRDAGAPYRAAMRRWIGLLRSNHLTVVISPLVASQGTDAAGRAQPALEVLPMLDAAEGVPFWRSVTAAFRRDSGVLFDLYNEPHDVSWKCWRDGCTVPAGTVNGSNGEPGGRLSYHAYPAAGMATLVRIIRRAEAKARGVRHVLVLGGLSYAGDLSHWLAFRPRGDSQLVAAIHPYLPTLAPCDAPCRSTLSAIARHFPVLTGELGETDCSGSLLDSYMSWADSEGISYLAWAFNPAAAGDTCGSSFPSLIQADGQDPDRFDGPPTVWGAAFRAHLRSLSGSRSTPHLARRQFGLGDYVVALMSTGRFCRKL